MPRVHSSSEESDADLETSFNTDAAKEIYKNWIFSQKRWSEMMALILMDTFIEQFGMTDVGAASEAGLVTGFEWEIGTYFRRVGRILKKGGQWTRAKRAKIFTISHAFARENFYHKPRLPIKTCIALV